MLFFTKIPLIGRAIERSFYRKTYYQMDAEQIYISAVHSCVMEAIDRISSEQGVRTLTSAERRLQVDTSKNRLEDVPYR